MKFRKITFKDHPILGDCCLDFTDAYGNTIDTIIIAGENGCGKTVLLNELYEYNPTVITDTRSGSIIAEIELNEYEIKKINNNPNTKQFLPQGIHSSLITVIQDFSIQREWDQIKVHIGESMVSGIILTTLQNSLKRIYSDVEVNFSPGQIKTVTAKNIDQTNNLALKSVKNLATDITQLLVDISALDDGELSYWVKTHRGEVPPEDIISVRMKRFTNAFHSMFSVKRFKGIENRGGHIVVTFEENGKEMSIDKLSSGEKQIVFRGGFLLKDKNSIEGAYVLIDEPEISLHPKWQLEILPFIKRLFTNERGEQTSQIIVATHSPFIIHNSNRHNDKVIVLQKSNAGNISVLEHPKFYSWCPQEIVREAFSINLSLDNDKMVVFVEGETDEQYYNKALEVYGFDRTKIHIEWIGRKVCNKVENTGDTALNNSAQFLKANKFLYHNHIVLLYDCDTKKQEEDIGFLHIRTMKKNNTNNIYKKGVENLLILPDAFDIDAYYTVTNKVDEYGAPSQISTLHKVKLCNDICSYSPADLQTIFANIKKELDMLFLICS